MTKTHSSGAHLAMKPEDKPQHRLPIIFDDDSFRDLEALRERGRFSTKSAVIREALMLRFALQDLHDRGLTKMIVQDPRSGEQKEISLKSLKNQSAVRVIG